MKPDSLVFILKSLERPQGIMEIYRAFEIGERGSARIPALNTCTELVKGYNEYGLAFKYGVHNTDVRLQLILTHQRSEYPFLRCADGSSRSVAMVEMITELQRFSYTAAELQRIGKGILAGHTLGPLEHAVLQEALSKDHHPGQIKQKVGSCLYALGEFVDQLYLVRELSID